MRLFDILAAIDPEIAPARCKVHLACWNGTEDPLQVYASGNFNGWQSWQTRRNFDRDFVVSLIQLSETGRWLFVGVHRSCEPTRELYPGSAKEYHHYALAELPAFTELSGRLVAPAGPTVLPQRRDMDAADHR